MPSRPSFQITMKAAKASSSAIMASASAPAKVVIAGLISSRPERTMMIASTVAASENKAMRRAQMASCEVACSYA